jgi:hypothetical protein
MRVLMTQIHVVTGGDKGYGATPIFIRRERHVNVLEV